MTCPTPASHSYYSSWRRRTSIFRGAFKALSAEPFLDATATAAPVAWAWPLCQAPIMADGLKYTGGALARVAELRRDEAWLEARLAAAETRLVPVWRGHNLVAGSANGKGRPSAVSVSGDAAAAAVAASAASATTGGTSNPK